MGLTENWKKHLETQGNNIQQSVEKSGPFGSSDTDTILLMDQKSYNTTWNIHENVQENKMGEILLIHPRNLTWIPKIAISKRVTFSKPSLWVSMLVFGNLSSRFFSQDFCSHWPTSRVLFESLINLVGGWTTHLKKNACQNGNLPQIGVKITKYLKPPAS